jgi:predicted PurR-regulated permease PerM
MFGLKGKHHENTVNINIPNRVVVRVMLVVVATLIALSAVKQASHALTLIFTALFLALALNSPVHWIAQRLPGRGKGSRTTATALSFFVVVVLLVGFLFSIVPPMVRQTSNFIGTIPDLTKQIHDESTDLGQFVAKYDLQDDIQKYSKQLTASLDEVSSTAVSSVQRLGSSLISVLTVLVLTFMMLIEGPRWRRFFRDLIPDHHHSRSDRLTHDMYRVIKGYVNGQVVLALLAALMLLPALLILQVPYPAALIVVVFICGLIPLVGHTIGAVIVSLVALFESPWSALFILLYYILYQQIENYIIQPRVQANSTNMSPLLVFSAVIIGVSFGGLLGGLVAIPVAGCLRILLLDYLRTKKIIEPAAVDTGQAQTGKV